MKMNDLPEPAVQTLRPLTIHLFAATAQGATAQAAFDAALADAGVAETERLRASPLIAPNTRIVCARPAAAPRADARVRCVVMSQMQQSRPGEHAHAGVAWVQRGDDGRGLFIDLHGSDRGRLEHGLHAAFRALRSLRDAAYGPVQTAFASRQCHAAPVCALVVAACVDQPC
jgi:pyruvoyl-dependent arginine decarboxylase (PvlArgDC)